MKKNRVIIADPDANYVMSLLKKFTDDYWDAVELELITDKSFFESFLDTPQVAELFIVGESFYIDTVNRHGFKNILILTENQEEGFSRNGRIYRICKYSSIREIFNVIAGRDIGLFHSQEGNPDQTKVIMIHSAVGGCGKTSLALGLCGRLAQEHKAVFYLDAENLQNFQALFPDTAPLQDTKVYTSLMNEDVNNYEAVREYIMHDSFDYLPPFKSACVSLGLPGRVFEEIIIKAKEAGDYDYIIVDTDHTFSEENAKLAGLADNVILVTRQDKQAAFALNNYLSNVNDRNDEKYICICSDFKQEETNVLSQYEDRYLIREYIDHIDNMSSLSVKNLAEIKGVIGLSMLIQ